MYRKENINSIHKQLSSIYSFGQVLLGGSHLYSEANEDSDLDFYLISNLRWFLNYVRHKEFIKEIKEKNPNIQLMLVPTLFFKRGWYYIYGQDVSGEIRISKINRKVIFRNSLKLACFHYLSFLLSNQTEEKRKFLIKSAQQVAVAATIRNASDEIDFTKPLFSQKMIRENLEKYDGKHRETIDTILDWKKSNAHPDINTLNLAGRQLLGVIAEVYDNAGSLLSFMPINYLIYNFKFLKRRNQQFLSANPDKQLLKKIINGIKTSINLEELYQEMKETIFPVFII